VWAVLLSYDIRNVSFAVPFLGFSIGSWPLVYKKKLISVFQIIKNFCCRHKMKIIVIYGMLVLTAGTVTSLVFNDALLNYNIKKRMYTGLGREMNSAILNFLKENPSVVIVTDYVPLLFLPDIDRSRIYELHYNSEKQVLSVLHSTVNSYLLTTDSAHQAFAVRMTQQGKLVPLVLRGNAGLYRYNVVAETDQTDADN
jgi:hypothetical protein